MDSLVTPRLRFHAHEIETEHPQDLFSVNGSVCLVLRDTISPDPPALFMLW